MTQDRRHALNIPQGRNLPSHHDAVYALVNNGLHDVLEQIHHGLTDEDRLAQVDRLAVLAMTIEPQLMAAEIEPIKAKFGELYDTLAVPEPPEPTSWVIEGQWPNNRWEAAYQITCGSIHTTYGSAHRTLQQYLRANPHLMRDKFRIIPIYPVITGA